MGEEPDEESEEEEEEYEEEEEVETAEVLQVAHLPAVSDVKIEESLTEHVIPDILTGEKLQLDKAGENEEKKPSITAHQVITPTILTEKKVVKRKVPKRKARVELFEEIDVSNPIFAVYFSVPCLYFSN